MNVAELIAKLSVLDPTIQVIQAKDEEGNGFTSTEDLSLELVERNYEGGELEDFFTREDLLADGDYEDHQIDTEFKEVVILWP